MEPFTRPTVLGVKLVPVKVTVVCGDPAASDEGDTLVTVGACTVTVKGDWLLTNS